jgi:hypothetical protein
VRAGLGKKGAHRKDSAVGQMHVCDAFDAADRARLYLNSPSKELLKIAAGR